MNDRLVNKENFDALWEALTYIVTEFKKPSGPTRNLPAAIRTGETILQKMGLKKSALEKQTIERDEYLRIVTMSAADARRFFGFDKDAIVIDDGPADRRRYREGARQYRVKSGKGVNMKKTL